MQALANPIPIRVVSKLIGFQDEDPDELLRVAFTSTAMLAATGPLEHQLDAMETSMGAVGWIVEQVDAAIGGAPAEGILGVVANAVNAGDLDVTDAFSVMATLLSAGGESTTSLLGNALHHLATHPDLQAELRGQPDALVPFIEEMLRLESPFRYHLRHAPASTELRGVEVPAGAAVLLLWGAANRDPAEYDRPDEVVLDRPAPRHHLGFGRGIHLCVGAPLARLEARVILEEILRRTTRIELDPDDAPLREHSLVVRRFARLPLRINAA
jgi:cytochrome P450